MDLTLVPQKGLYNKRYVTYMKYESSTTHHSKVIGKVKASCEKCDHNTDLDRWHLTLVPQKGLTTRNTHVECERSITHLSKVMVKVKASCEKCDNV